MTTWDSALNDWATFLTAIGRPKTTVDLRIYHLRRFSSCVLDPWVATMDDMLEWMAAQDWAPNTRRAYRQSLRSFYTWATSTGRIGSSPAEALPTVAIPRPKPRPAPDDAVAWALMWADERAALAIRLAAHCGLRRTEIAQVKTVDVEADLLGHSLRVVGKGGHVRMVPLPDDLARAILRAPAGWLFPSPKGGHLTPHHLGKIISRHLPEGYTTHNLRHSAGTKAYQGTKDLRAVQEFLGHSKPETTAIYTQVSNEDVRAAMMAAAA